MKHSEFLERFTGGTLDRSDWTHEAHVRAAWLCLDRCDGDAREALAKVRSGIVALNKAYHRQAAVGCGFSEGQGGLPPAYHATLTTAFVRVIAGRMQPGENYARFRANNPDLYADKLGPVLAHYTRGRLFSPEARSRYIKPDLKPLPMPRLELATA